MDINAASASLRQLQQRMQQLGLADFADVNVPIGKLSAQFRRLKQLLNQSGVADALDINLDPAKLDNQLKKIAGIAETIKVNFDVAKLPLPPELADLIQTIQVRADTSSALSAIDTLKARMSELNDTVAKLRIEMPDDLPLQAKLAKLQDSLLGLAKTVAKIQIGGDTTQLDQAIAREKATLAGLQLQASDLKMNADTTKVIARIAEIDAVVAHLRKSMEKMTADVDVTRANTKIRALLAEQAVLESRARNIKMDADASALNAKIAESTAKIAAMTQQAHDIKFNIDVQGIASADAQLLSMETIVAGLRGAIADTTPVLGAFRNAMAQTTPLLFTAITGWFGLTTTITLFGGILGFQTKLWHIVAEAILETLIAVGLAAIGLAALAAAVGIFIGVAVLAQDTLGRISDRLKAVYTASTATGQAIAPMTSAFDNLAHVIRPQVWQLYGDALNLTTGRMGLLGNIAVKTGSVIDQFAGKVIAFINQPSVQTGFTNLIKTGITFAEQFGRIFLNLGQALGNFFKVAQFTHIADGLLAIVNAAAKLINWISRLPTPLLAAVVGLHAFYIWGGLLTTVVIQMLDPLRALALAMGGVDLAATALGANPAASGLERLKAVVSDIGTGFAALPGKIAGTNVSISTMDSMVASATIPALKDLEKQSVQSLESMVTGSQKAQIGMLALQYDLNAAQQKVLLMGAASGATSAEMDAMAGSEELAAVATTGLATAMKGLAASMLALLANPLTWIAVAAAGIAVFTYKIFTANDATQQWINKTNQALAASNQYQVIGKTVADLAATTQKLADVQRGAAGNAGELAAAQNDLSAKLGTELTHVGQISKAYGTDMVGALNLLQAAGVKTGVIMNSNNKTWAAALVQVAGLVAGYKAMGQGLTELQNDVSVLLVSNSDQLKQMDKLNTAWDTWTKLVSSPTTDILSLSQTLSRFANDAQAAGASMTGMAGVVGTASQKVRTSSVQLQQDFQDSFTAVNKLFDSFRSSQAVTGQGDFTAFVKDAVSALIPFAQHNRAAAAEVSALAQEAGGPATTNLATLAKWAGNVKDPMNALYKASENATIATSNLSQDAARLSTTLQQDLNPAMAQAAFNALGGQKAFNTFASDLVKFGPDSQVTAAAGGKVVDMLLAIDKNSGQAKSQFIGWAESMGLSKDKAESLWKSANKLSTTGYKIQIQDNIRAEKKNIFDLEKQLSQTTDPAKRRQIELAIKVDESKLKAMEGDLNKAQGSAGQLNKNLASGATSADNLAKSGLWAQMKDLTTQGFSQIGNFFSTQLPGFFEKIPDYASHAWGKVWDGPKGFFHDVVLPINNWLTQSLPHAWDVASHGAGTGWSVAYEAFQRDFAGKLTAWFTQSLPHAFGNIGTAFSTAWGTAYNGFQRDFAGPITHWATVLLPKSIAGIAVSTAWSTAYENFQRDFAGKITAWFTQSLPHAIDRIGGAFSTAWGTAWNGFNRDIGGKLENFFAKTFPNYLDGAGRYWNSTWSKGWANFVKDIWNPFAGFFTKSVQGYLDGAGRYWNSTWSKGWTNFVKDIWNPFAGFFTKTVQGYLDGAGRYWNSTWSKAWTNFVKDIWNPFAGFFTKTIPGWFGGTGTSWNSLWKGAWNAFVSDVWNPLSGFFTKSLPNYLSGAGRAWNSTWSKGWADFVRDIFNPVKNWFTNVLPNAMIDAFKNGINGAIRLLNRAIGFINTVTSVVGIPAIGGVHTLAKGGKIEGGTRGKDSVVGLLMPGELVVPAKMVEAGAVDHLKGKLPGFAGGGLVNPIGTGLRPGRIDQGVDYSGAGNLYAIGHGQIRQIYSSGWPGGAFISERVDQGSIAGKYWYMAEDIIPRVGVDATVNPGQLVGRATGGSTGIEVGFAAPGMDITMARATGQTSKGVDNTGWGKAASDLIRSLGGPGGILSGTVQGGTPGISGGFAAIWQSIEGLLSSAGNALSPALSGLSKFVSGGAKELLSLAKQGGRAVFDAVWNHTIQPLVDKGVPGDKSAVGAVLKYVAKSVRNGVDTLMSAKDSAAQTNAANSGGISAGTPGPGGGNAGANAALARKLMPAWSGGTEWLAWNALEMAEAGWNQFARNPSSGAYGIPQALPPSKMGAAANPPQSNPTAQINWMISYIKSVYGDPIGANRHENMFHWYDSPGGKMMPPGYSMSYNGTGRNEHMAPVSPIGGGGLSADARAIVNALERNTHAVQKQGASFGQTLNGTMSRAANQGYYS